ncbi:peptide chain release factor-like protein [Penicillium sp. IBT 18751x]|nr:peptide chain release factor-like protein [Penicillium sp. IBT 18751x]
MLRLRPGLGPLKPSIPLSTLIPSRTFTQTPVHPEKPLPARLKLNDADLTVSYLKGTGPGGQKINKTNSAVQITHGPSGIVIKCQATRSRSQNEKIARSLLADRVEAREKGDKSRVALKAEAAKKKKASKVKKAKRKYRALEKGEEGAVEAEAEDLEDGLEDAIEDELQGQGGKVETRRAGETSKGSSEA